MSESATASVRYVDQVPAMITVRKMISVRGFDADGWMQDADAVPGGRGAHLETMREPRIAYLHAHNAGPG